MGSGTVKTWFDRIGATSADFRARNHFKINRLQIL